MSKNQTGMPAGVKRPAVQSQQIHLPVSLCLSRPPWSYQTSSPKIPVRDAQILLSNRTMGFAGLTAKKEGIELPPPKNNAQREHLQLDQALELKRAFVIFANIRREQSVKMAASLMRFVQKRLSRVLATQVLRVPRKMHFRERPYFGKAA
jgi:hypothetical protein